MIFTAISSDGLKHAGSDEPMPAAPGLWMVHVEVDAWRYGRPVPVAVEVPTLRIGRLQRHEALVAAARADEGDDGLAGPEVSCARIHDAEVALILEFRPRGNTTTWDVRYHVISPLRTKPCHSPGYLPPAVTSTEGASVRSAMLVPEACHRGAGRSSGGTLRPSNHTRML